MQYQQTQGRMENIPRGMSSEFCGATIDTVCVSLQTRGLHCI